MKKVYLDYAATTPVLPTVADAMYDILKNQYGNPSSIHSFGRTAKSIVEESRRTIATSIKASLAEVFFTSGATESFHTAVHSSIRDLGVKQIISSPVEHHCTLHTLDHIQKENLATTTFLDVDKNGFIDYNQLGEVLASSQGKSLVCLMHVNNELGSKHDLKKLSDICAENEAFLLIDAAQSFGKYPIDLHELNISFVTASAHKLFGPKGTGLLYVNNNNVIGPQMLGGAQERNMRAGTENIHGMVGFAKATALCIEEFDQRAKALRDIKVYCMEQLTNATEDIQFNGPAVLDDAANHILSVSFPENEKSDLLMFNLDIAGICASSGSACASGVENDSHVLQAIGHDPKRKTIRFSFSHYTTKEEIDYLAEVVHNIHQR